MLVNVALDKDMRGRDVPSPVMLPILTDDNGFYWEGTRSQQLLLQQCDECGLVRHPPTPTCTTCRSLEWHTVSAAGGATVYSCVIPRHPQFERFGSGYVIALVDLDDGPRFLCNVRADDPSSVEIGDRVEMFFEPLDDGYYLPQFRPAAQS